MHRLHVNRAAAKRRRKPVLVIAAEQDADRKPGLRRAGDDGTHDLVRHVMVVADRARAPAGREADDGAGVHQRVAARRARIIRGLVVARPGARAGAERGDAGAKLGTMPHADRDARR